jgi:predicted PhzF superfamily epimerase YddE/YHI9
MRLPLYQVDAFTSRVFSGNPAAVCPLDEWLDDSTMQAIAAENNLSETAFFVRRDGGDEYEIRWFTPRIEVDLCGHATLASAHVLFAALGPDRTRIVFRSKSGPLAATREGDRMVLDFPARPGRSCDPPAGLSEALGREPREVWRARDLMAVFDSEDDVQALQPNFAALAAMDAFAVCVTAPGSECDFVSRFFAPAFGIDEDPVTGSSHCTLVPYWAERLGDLTLHARQLSARGGELFCELRGDRVRIGGRAVRYLEGWIDI